MKSIMSVIYIMAAVFFSANDDDDDDPVAGRGGYN
jgi:hypothetical protein